MKITLDQLHEARGSLNKLMLQDELTAKMKRRLRVLAKEINELDKEKEALMIKHKAKRNERGYYYFAPDQMDELEAYDMELDELLAEEIEIAYTPVKLKEIEELKDDKDKPLIKLHAHDYNNLLEVFLEEEAD